MSQASKWKFSPTWLLIRYAERHFHQILNRREFERMRRHEEQCEEMRATSCALMCSGSGEEEGEVFTTRAANGSGGEINKDASTWKTKIIDISVWVCRAALRPRLINMKYSKIYMDFVCIARHYVITVDYCVSVNVWAGLGARERLVFSIFFPRAEGQRQAHQSFSEAGGCGEQSEGAWRIPSQQMEVCSQARGN